MREGNLKCGGTGTFLWFRKEQFFSDEASHFGGQGVGTPGWLGGGHGKELKLRGIHTAMGEVANCGGEQVGNEAQRSCSH